MIVCFNLKWLDIEKGVVSNDREEREAPIQFRVSWKCFVNVVDSFEWIINGRNREQKIENHSTQHVKLAVCGNICLSHTKIVVFNEGASQQSPKMTISKPNVTNTNFREKYVLE